MGTETVVDYETVEKETTVYVCDNCDARFEDDSKLTTVAFHDQYHRQYDPKRMIECCPKCCNLPEILELEDQRERYRDIVGSVVQKTSKLRYLATSMISFGFGIQATLLLGAVTSDPDGSIANFWSIGDFGIAIVVVSIAQAILILGYIFVSNL